MKENLTERDRDLIRQANEVTNCIDWGILCSLEEQAESEEAKKIIDGRLKYLYHMEEAMCDCL